MARFHIWYKLRDNADKFEEETIWNDQGLLLLSTLLYTEFLKDRYIACCKDGDTVFLLSVL